MKTIIISFTLICSLLLSFQSYAQDDYQEWLKKDQQAYETYLSEQDKAFMEFLKADWEAFQSFKGIQQDTTPKPVDTPYAPNVEEPESTPESAPPPVELPETPEPPEPVEPQPRETPEPEPEAPSEPAITEPEPPEPVSEEIKEPAAPEPVAPEPEEPQQPAQQISFYDTTLTIPSAESIELQLDKPVNNESIAAAWEKLAQADLGQTIEHLNHLTDQMLLNDWGFLKLAQNYSEVMFPDCQAKQLILDWFIANKSGYKVKLSYQDNTILLLLPFEQTVYEMPFTDIDGQRYYFYSPGKSVDTGKPLYSYKQNYPDAVRSLDLSLIELPDITGQTGGKTLNFNYNQQPIKLTVGYKKDAVSFLTDYPQSDLNIFVESRPSQVFHYSFVKALKPHIEGKNELEAVNLLLRFVQTGFEYLTDDEQFGKEKYLLPEETVHYKASDCEDRSILFSYLVHELLGNKVVLLDFPGHICTAVQLNTQLQGDHITYKGDSYTVCDPTYINATAGMLMPNFAGVQPNVIEYQ